MKKIFLFIFIVFSFSAFDTHQVSLKHKWTSDTLLKTCESVIYLEKEKIIVVSNIDGDPTAKDNNGFLSQLNIDGSIKKLKWIEGLNAPKGMGVVGNTLYVTDIDEIVLIDIKKGKIAKKIKVKNAQFLNDITTDASGSVYISDMNTQNIHKIDSKGKLSVFAKEIKTQGLNGLLAKEDALYLLDMKEGSMFKMSYDEQKLKSITDGLPNADGLMSLDKEAFLVSSWHGQVYLVAHGHPTLLLDTQEQKLNAADAWYIEKEKLLLIPTFYGNSVMAYSVKY
jgi:sugar lactone lactonase YvrE